MNTETKVSGGYELTAKRRATLIASLVQARKQRGISQSQLSKLLGMSVPGISRFESGSHNPTLDVLLRYAQAVDVQVVIDDSLPLPDALPMNAGEAAYAALPVQNLPMAAENRVDDYNASEMMHAVVTYELRLYDQVLMIFTLDIAMGRDWGLTTIDYVDAANAHLLPPELMGEEKDIFKWLSRRNIPKNREHFRAVLESLGLKRDDLKGILAVSKALSLNDSYWVVPQGFKGRFKDFNLYENSFSAAVSLIAYTGIHQSVHRFRTSPELSTNGMLPKAWRRIENDGIFLFKGGTFGFANAGLEPYSEYYAYQIANQMGLDATPYDLVKWKGILASKCKLFTDIETSFVPIGRILKFGYGDESLYRAESIDTLIGFYHKLGDRFENALRSMLVFDSIIYNTDRHYGNFGLLRENATGEYLAPAPIFDNGLSLLCYAMKTDLTSIDSKYIRDDLFPVSAQTFDEQYKRVAKGLQRQQLRRLLQFKFIPHPRYNLEPERLEFLNRFVQHRVNTLLEIDIVISIENQH